VRKHFAEVFLKMNPAAKMLKPSRQSVEIISDGMSAWDSFVGATENAFVFYNGIGAANALSRLD
jgi:hypothetical protein